MKFASEVPEDLQNVPLRIPEEQCAVSVVAIADAAIIDGLSRRGCCGSSLCALAALSAGPATRLAGRRPAALQPAHFGAPVREGELAQGRLTV